MTTGNDKLSDGTIQVSVDGITQVASTYFAQGEVVLDSCFPTLPLLKVANPTTNGWGGTITVTDNGKEEILSCNGCTGVELVKDLAVDGNSDGSILASTHCLNGNACIVFVAGIIYVFLHIL